MTTNDNTSLPRVRLVGEFDHPDFGKAMELLRASVQITNSPDDLAELIVVAQSRAGAISGKVIQSLRREAPLAGMIALLGTWCEGESRTGRPWPGVDRLYWYEFPTWWRRQLSLRAAGRCPDWSQPNESAQASRVVPDPGLPGSQGNCKSPNGLIVLSTPVRDTAAAFREVLQPAGYATIWAQSGRQPAVVRGAAAGIWDGGQLNEREADNLTAFSRDLARDAAPVIAMLDFPRRDRCDRARELGAAAILGKPWLNAELLATVEELTINYARRYEPTLTRAA